MIPASMWLFDNFNLMYRVLKKFQESGELRSYRQLPVVVDDLTHAKPRIYKVAHTIISCCNNRLRNDQIIELLNIYQKSEVLKSRELEALPGILSLCLLEKLIGAAREVMSIMRSKALADQAADRILNTSQSTNPSDFNQIIDYAAKEVSTTKVLDLTMICQLFLRLHHLPVNRHRTGNPSS